MVLKAIGLDTPLAKPANHGVQTHVVGLLRVLHDVVRTGVVESWIVRAGLKVLAPAHSFDDFFDCHVHAAHSADNASACCKTFCTAASCKSGG